MIPEGGPATGLLRAFGLVAALVLVSFARTPARASVTPPARIVLVTIDGLPGDADPSLLPATLRSPDGACRWRPGSPASAESPLPFPATVAILTGCDSARTGVAGERDTGVRAAAPTLAERLRARGYHGLALPADVMTHAGSGLARGFERWALDGPALEDSARVDSALAWLRAPGRRFVWLALSYGAPAESWRRADGCGPRTRAEFVAASAEIDDGLRRLRNGLASRRAKDGTLILVCGAAAPSSGARTPGHFADAFAGAPVTAWGCGEAAPGAGPARLVDVAPTLLARTGASAAGMSGHDLLAAARGPVRAAEPPVPSADAPATRACREALLAELARAGGGRDSLALPRLDSLAEANPGDARVAMERAYLLSRSGREGDAATIFKSQLAAHPDEPAYAIAYADHLLRHKRWDVVRPNVESVRASGPYGALAQWRLAAAYANAADFVAATGAAERAERLAIPTEGARGLARAFRRLTALADSVAAAPRDPALKLAFGRALGECELYEAAYPQFHAARALLPRSAEPDFGLASLLMRQGRTQNAIATLERALAADSTHRPSRLLLAEAHMERGERGPARVQLERVLGTGRGEPRDLYNLACLRATDGDTRGALDALERAVTAGYDDWAGIDADRDLDAVRGDARFRALRERAGR